MRSHSPSHLNPENIFPQSGIPCCTRCLHSHPSGCAVLAAAPAAREQGEQSIRRACKGLLHAAAFLTLLLLVGKLNEHSWMTGSLLLPSLAQVLLTWSSRHEEKSWKMSRSVTSSCLCLESHGPSLLVSRTGGTNTTSTCKAHKPHSKALGVSQFGGWVLHLLPSSQAAATQNSFLGRKCAGHEEGLPGDGSVLA